MVLIPLVLYGKPELLTSTDIDNNDASDSEAACLLLPRSMLHPRVDICAYNLITKVIKNGSTICDRSSMGSIGLDVMGVIEGIVA